ncbi:hypothetical protein [Salinisphaera hydrothermalis]|uniref:hypothetical protein n=1 Tax=Salinisphaera hydrothermalis TaxID=563188 RepID=UPI003341F72E
MAGEAKMAVSVLLNARDKLTGSVSNAKRMTTKLGRTIDRVGRSDGFQRLRRSIRRTGDAAKRVIGRVAKIGAGVTAAATGAALTVGHMVAKFASGADETAKLADQLGIGVKALQEWRFVAERQGVSQSTFNQSLAAFTKRVGEAQNGTGALTTQLKKSNPELLKQLQNTTDTSQALDLYLKAISKAPTATKKAALASAAFSRAGLGMIRITRDGADNIDQLRKRAEELGLVLDEKTARQAETFDDRLTDMQGSLTGVKNILGAQLLPVFTKVMDQITKWVVKNQGAVKAWAQNFAADLPGRLHTMRQRFDEIVVAAGHFIDKAKPVAKTVLAIADRFGRMNVAVAAVAAVIAAPILAPLVSLTAGLVSLGGTLVSLSAAAIPAVASALSWLTAAIVANPIGAAITAIAGAALLIYKYWGPISAFAKRTWNTIAGVVSAAYDKITNILGWDPLSAIKPAFEGAWNWLSNLDWSEAGKKLIGTLVGGLKKAAGAVKDAVKGALSKARNLLPFSDAKEGPLSDLTKSGTRLPSTFATGVLKNQGALVGAVDKVMAAANGRMNDRVVPLRSASRQASAEAVKDAVKGALFKARNLLPFSDAKEGPLSDLTKSGTRLPSTFATGVLKNQDVLVGAVDKVMAAANGRMNDRVVPLRSASRQASAEAVTPSQATSAPAMLFGTGQTAAAGGRSTHVGRVDVNAPITIHMQGNDRPEDVGQAVQSKISDIGLWSSIQDLPEEDH